MLRGRGSDPEFTAFEAHPDKMKSHYLLSRGSVKSTMVFMKRKILKSFDRAAVYTLVFISISFFLFGTEFLSWFYILGDFFPAEQTYLYGKVGGYFFEAAGILLCGVLVAKAPYRIISSRYLSAVILLIELVFTIPAFFLKNAAMIVTCGYLFNLACGINFGLYLTMLGSRTPRRVRGTVMALGTAIGSAGSWLVTEFAGSEFLKSRDVLIVYAAFTAAGVIFLLIFSVSIVPVMGAMNDSLTSRKRSNSRHLSKKALILLCIVVFLFGMINDISNSFPTGDAIGGVVPVELARLFHAAGLVAAGIISDLNRKNGAVACLILLIVPFIMFAIRDYAGSPFVTLAVFYTIGAFYSVFRVISFTDLADEGAEYLFMAGGGLMCGRIGECAGAAINTFIGENILALVLTAGVLIALSVIVFIRWQTEKDVIQIRKEAGIEPETEPEEKPSAEEFASRYGLSSRELEVFGLIIEGFSNAEISQKLYISENTVKFHIKNILRKTESANRIELSALYNGGIVKGYK